jgi:hypothetical protein
MRPLYYLLCVLLIVERDGLSDDLKATVPEPTNTHSLTKLKEIAGQIWELKQSSVARSEEDGSRLLAGDQARAATMSSESEDGDADKAGASALAESSTTAVAKAAPARRNATPAATGIVMGSSRPSRAGDPHAESDGDDGGGEASTGARTAAVSTSGAAVRSRLSARPQSAATAGSGGAMRRQPRASTLAQPSSRPTPADLVFGQLEGGAEPLYNDEAREWEHKGCYVLLCCAHSEHTSACRNCSAWDDDVQE